MSASLMPHRTCHGTRVEPAALPHAVCLTNTQTAGMMLARAVLVTLAVVLLAAAHQGAAQTLDDCSSLGPGCLQVSCCCQQGWGCLQAG